MSAKPKSSTDGFSPEQIVSYLYRCLPNAEQVKWIDIGTAYMRFEWRGKNFQITVDSLMVEQFDDKILSSSDEAILIGALIKKQWVLEGRE